MKVVERLQKGSKGVEKGFKMGLTRLEKASKGCSKYSKRCQKGINRCPKGVSSSQKEVKRVPKN
jgi:hypothetical protein